jgi:acetyl esterase/lipase
VAAIALLCGCASDASPTSSPTGSANPPSAAVATPTPTITTPATPAPTPGVVATYDVAYESADPVLIPGELDVYAPAEAGPWPVVVLFPVFDGLHEHARKVAELGFVVFVPSWGDTASGIPAVPGEEYLRAANAQGACAVEFARAHAAEYGGDPESMILFGHSAGAHIAAAVAFARPELSADCLAATKRGAIDALVTWEGNWLLAHNALDWDAALAADPGVMDIVTPWTSLANDKDLKVVMLVSEDPSLSLESEFPGIAAERPVGDPWAADSWLAVRDPSGALRRQLEGNGAFADGTIGYPDSQQLLFSVLKAQGNPVTLDVMPDSSHAWLAGDGWDVFLAAFPKAAAKD